MTGGRLTTHVLDTATGKPAADVAVTLYAFDGAARRQIAATRTNHDGRTDAPLLSGAAMATGVYELEFEVGAYFRACGLTLASPLFLDVVPLRFGLSDPSAHYHVPLLLSPFGYSTYRGS